jgi:hypothetical protein
VREGTATTWSPAVAWPIPSRSSVFGYRTSGSQPARRTNWWGIASLCASVLWILGIGSLLGIVFGVRARRVARRSGVTAGLGTAGVVIGIVGLLAIAVLVAQFVDLSIRLHELRGHH